MSSLKIRILPLSEPLCPFLIHSDSTNSSSRASKLGPKRDHGPGVAGHGWPVKLGRGHGPGLAGRGGQYVRHAQLDRAILRPGRGRCRGSQSWNFEFLLQYRSRWRTGLRQNYTPLLWLRRRNLRVSLPCHGEWFERVALIFI